MIVYHLHAERASHDDGWTRWIDCLDQWISGEDEVKVFSVMKELLTEYTTVLVSLEHVETEELNGC